MTTYKWRCARRNEWLTFDTDDMTEGQMRQLQDTLAKEVSQRVAFEKLERAKRLHAGIVECGAYKELALPKQWELVTGGEVDALTALVTWIENRSCE